MGDLFGQIEDLKHFFGTRHQRPENDMLFLFEGGVRFRRAYFLHTKLNYTHLIDVAKD